MRNLHKYPITIEEIVSCLQELIKEFNPELIGDMRPVLLQEAIRIIENTEYP